MFVTVSLFGGGERIRTSDTLAGITVFPPEAAPPLAGKTPDERGGGEIRTHGTFAGTTVFKTAPLNHSGTPPRLQGTALPRLRSGAGQGRPVHPGLRHRL